MADYKYVAIHGHFYQPPRENPWTGVIEQQKSAAPYHNWNERINTECYHPNGFSRILNAHQQIEDIVLNFSHINFNIGPTLLDWIQSHDPKLYERILEADRESQKQFGGHGSAIAQVYNHIIMPLANERDRITQIEWGLAHFEHHFKRRPEAMWLAETAVNAATLRDLIQYGMKYVILSPMQANSIRAMDQTEWIDVNQNEIDARRPYRIYVGEDQKIYIDVFFYDQTLSTGISFMHYLKDANVLAQKFEQAFDSNETSIVTACTDGESYGHHEPFGDMCLAYLLHPSEEKQVHCAVC